MFCIAGISDALDGLAARKLNAGSEFGRMLDPIADKILVAVALMMIVAEHSIHQFNLIMSPFGLLKLVPALIILAREILVSGLREFLAGAKVSIPVTVFAKFKTAIQMIAIGAMILTPLADRFLPDVQAITYSAFAYGLLWVAAALTSIRALSIFGLVCATYTRRRLCHDAALFRLGAAEDQKERRATRSSAGHKNGG
ncbi:MAG: CDP-alcohol phosphatidyltransferase family protein [Rhizomicrobium sp.]